MCDIGIKCHLPTHHRLDQLRHLRPRLPATERSSFPVSSSHQLERSGWDFLAGGRNTDNTTFAPATVSHLEGTSHDLHDTGAVVGVVVAPLLPGQQPGLDIPTLAGHAVNALRGSHGYRPGELPIVNVDAHNVPRTYLVFQVRFKNQFFRS